MGFLSNAWNDISGVANSAYSSTVGQIVAGTEVLSGVGLVTGAKKFLSVGKNDTKTVLRGFKPVPPTPVAAAPLVAPNPDDPTATAASLLNQQRMYQGAGYAGTILSSANGGGGSSGNTLG